ncbi:VapE domain-containing protein [Ramlibacter alkalitolerans]|uniref:Virulence-associated E family protein n=1 Tax=Ramlibacter alkalitolerans TaxID=2039631 RepID=A0ABS1JWN0_9BURK|nr:VapE domain-containing protein [Ramlibacter alkalitolerans]MBL0428720.1 virulence-associated E family protein [Ramlibacter alkalitolerans]
MPATITNTAHLLNLHGIIVRYNVIKKKTEILLPTEAECTTDNADNVALTHIISAAALNNLPTGQIPAYVEAIADATPYNPVAEWIKSRDWDGLDRLKDLYATIETREDFPDGLKQVLLRRWLLSAVAAALMPRGFKARGVLTIQGGQGIGKTTWIRSLINHDLLRETAIKVDHHLDASNKDTILGAIAHWIVEIGELDSTFRKDVARLKGFLTSDQDKLRRPYARGESEYARRTVFAATVNETNFLVDLTGNTRWWTLPAVKIDHQHRIDMQQVYAQLAVDFAKGEQWWLTSAEEVQLEECNRAHLNVSALREEMLNAINTEGSAKPTDPYMGPSDVLKHLGHEKPTNAQAKECAALLREFFGEAKRVKGYNKWRVPFREARQREVQGQVTELP